MFSNERNLLLPAIQQLLQWFYCKSMHCSNLQPECDAVLLGNWYPTFQRTVLPSFSGVYLNVEPLKM